MTDRDCGEDHDEPAIFFRPVEQRVGQDGTEEVILQTLTFAKDDEERIAIEEKFSRQTGSRRLADGEVRSFHAFSSGSWTSPWNPQPKPINRRPSQDNPSLN